MINKLCAAAIVVALSGTSALSADAWPPFEMSTGAQGKTISFSPLAKAQKKWNLCVVVPHMKDSYWVAADYGLITEAQRLGISLTIYQAGGYDQLPKQIAQLDDCMVSKPDAILVAPISEAGLAAKLKEAADKNIVTVGLINPIVQAPVSARVTNDRRAMGVVGAQTLIKLLGDKGGKVVAFPGPQGSGWAEEYLTGFKATLDGSKVGLLADKFGETGVAVQLRLVEDALQTYSDMTAIWGTGPTAEAAAGAVAEAGKNVTIVSSYSDQSSIDLLKKGRIGGFISDSTVMQARIAVNQAVNILEGRPGEKLLVSQPRAVTKDDLSTVDFTTMLAPKDFQPSFSVK